MSELMKGKYEVIRVLRSTILDALIDFGQFSVVEGEKVCTWKCIEASQQALRNADKVVTMKMTGSKQAFRPYSKYDGIKGERTEVWTEEQTWEIAVLLIRTTEPVTATTITSEDVANNIALWMNTRGIEAFRKKNMANLFVSLASIKGYNDASDVNQNKASFELKIQVPRVFTTEYGFASPEYEDTVGV